MLAQVPRTRGGGKPLGAVHTPDPGQEIKVAAEA